MRKLLFLFAGLFAGATLASPPPVQPAQLQKLQAAHDAPLLLDVRTATEYRDGHIAGALNIPVDQVAARHGVLGSDRDREIVVYCHSGRRAARAQATLERLGYRDVRLLDGSILRWRDEHRPLRRESGARANTHK